MGDMAERTLVLQFDIQPLRRFHRHLGQAVAERI